MRRLAPALLVAAVAMVSALQGARPGGSVAVGRTRMPDRPRLPVPTRRLRPDRRGGPERLRQLHPADRPGDGDDIRSIVHDTEASYDDAIATFQNPRSGVSSHYVIQASDGQVTQLVHTSDIAFHAGKLLVQLDRDRARGVLVDGGRDYTEAMYRSSARLIRYRAARYDIPLDREHILGHEDVPAPTAGAHYDPGPFWDWARYFDLLGAPLPVPWCIRTAHPHHADRGLGPPAPWSGRPHGRGPPARMHGDPVRRPGSRIRTARSPPPCARRS